MDVLTSETCWALNNEIIKQVTSSWSLSIQLVSQISFLSHTDRSFLCTHFFTVVFYFLAIGPHLLDRIPQSPCACPLWSQIQAPARKPAVLMLLSSCTNSPEASSGERFLHPTSFPFNNVHQLPYHWKLYSCLVSAAQKPSSGVGSLPVEVSKSHTR